jgi:hypothetical protein
MVAGGIAVNLYGIERATADIDLVVSLEEENLLKFVKVARTLELKPRLPVTLDDFVDENIRRNWILDKGMMVFSLYDTQNPFFLIDVFVNIPFEFDDVYTQRTEIDFGETVIPLVPIRTLITMKEESNRPQDKADTFYLKRILEEWEHEE